MGIRGPTIEFGFETSMGLGLKNSGGSSNEFLTKSTYTRRIVIPKTISNDLYPKSISNHQTSNFTLKETFLDLFHQFLYYQISTYKFIIIYLIFILCLVNKNNIFK